MTDTTSTLHLDDYVVPEASLRRVVGVHADYVVVKNDATGEMLAVPPTGLIKVEDLTRAEVTPVKPRARSINALTLESRQREFTEIRHEDKWLTIIRVVARRNHAIGEYEICVGCEHGVQLWFGGAEKVSVR